jgi:membrane dipeptidase
MDGHVHMINRQFYLGGDITDSYKDGQVDLPRIRKGGLKAIFFSLFSSEEYYPRRFEVKHTMQLMDLALRQIEKHHDQIEIALTASDIERINRAGKIAAVLDLEGGFDLDGDLGVLRDLYRLGLRAAMLSSHNFTNNFADSCCAPPKWNGVNERGRAVVAEMNRLGMVINVAHASNEAILQTAELSRAPVLYSHGGSRHFVDTPRNLTDEAARKIASKGGVIGLQFGNTFSNPKYYEWRQKGRPFGDVSSALKRYGAYDTIEALDAAVAKTYPSEPQVPPEEFRMGIDRLVDVIDY